MATGDAAWVDVLPSLAKFTPELKAGLKGVMPKAGQEAGTEYARGFTQTVVSGVEAASRQVAAARKKEADAAGAVRVAEAKLQDLRASGRAKTAQLVAAEENLAKASRTLGQAQDTTVRSTSDLATAQQHARRGTDGLGDGMRQLAGSSAKAGDALGGAELAIGKVAAAAGGALTVVNAFWDTVGGEQANDLLAAQLDLTAGESERAGKVAGGLFRDAYGDSLDEVNAALRGVQNNIGELADFSNAELDKMGERALNLAKIMGEDVDRVTRGVGQLIRNGLARDATEGFDLITAAAQRLPASMQGELIDTIEEYSADLHQLGLDGPAALGAISAAVQAGARNTDLAADALREFSIRALDGSELTAGAFEDLGFSAEDMAAKIAAGGPAAATATSQIIRALAATGDKVQQEQLGVALFGTQYENLGITALAALDPLASRLDDVAGASDRMGETLNDNFASRLEGWKRNAAGFAQDGLLAIADGFSRGEVTSSGWVGALEGVGVVLGTVYEAGRDVLGFVTDLPGPLQLGIVAFAGWLVVGGKVMGILRGMGSTLSPLRGAWRSFGDALEYARQRGDGAGTVLKSVGSYAGGQAVQGLKAFARAIGPELGVAAAVYAIGSLSTSISTMVNAGGDAVDEVRELDRSLGEIDGNTARIQATASAVEDLRNKLADARAVLDETGGGDIAAAFGNPLLLASVKAGYDDAAASVDVYKQALDALEEEQAVTASTAERIGNVMGISADAVLNLADKYGVDLSDGLLLAYPALLAAGGAIDGVSGSAEGATLSGDVLTVQLQDVASAADAAKQSTDLFKLSLDILTGATVSMAEVEAAFWASVAQADGALENMSGTVLDSAGNLNVQSEAGRAAQDVLFGVRDSGNQLIATMIQQGATAEEVNAKDAQLRESFIHTAMQMGISEQAAWALTEQIFGIPSERETTITADTSQPTAAVSSLQTLIDNLHGRVVDIQARAILPDLNGSVSGSGRMGTFAEGGPTPPGPKYRAAGIVHAGENVWSQADVSAWGGMANVEALRTLRVPGFAGGGPVPPVSIRAELDTRSYESAMDGYARQMIDLYEPVMGYVGALNWARTQVGSPYIWGGVGPTGYDCSGFMSAITNYIRGRSPYSRVGSTATFPWAGFVPGYGLFSIGSTSDAGGGIGHMAGTLVGVNVESTGGVGVRVGGSARGASDGLFSTRAHLLDEGGLWPPGWGFNATGDIERVLTPEQDDYFRRFVDIAGRGAAAPAGPTHFTGDLYLDSGEFLGKVRGEATAVVEAADRRTDIDWRSARG